MLWTDAVQVRLSKAVTRGGRVKLEGLFMVRRNSRLNGLFVAAILPVW